MNKKYPTVVCRRCTTCCTEPVVPVTAKDVSRLVKCTGASAESIVRFYTQDEMEFDSESGLWIEFSGTKKAMGLRKKKGRCRFLSSKGLCMVYKSRPMTCRTFPYSVLFGSDGSVRKVKINSVVSSCCCEPSDDVDLEPVFRDSKREESEDISYYKKIALWNRRHSDSSSGEFLEFCGLGGS